MASFQVKLGGEWKNYEDQEDKILKRAFMAGFPNARFELRGQKYVYDFTSMVQKNADTAKERQIRAPHGWKAPSKPIVPEGPTTVITVPAGSPGTTISVPHPKLKGQYFSVNVPPSARPGQAMLVPIPDRGEPPASTGADVAAGAAVASSGDAEAVSGAVLGGSGEKKKKPGMSTGKKVAVGTAAAVGVAGAAVGGAFLGDHIVGHGLDATIEAAGEGLEDAGEAIADFAVDAGEFIVDGAEDVGDFIMDLF